jgi:diadenosine tetraphosphatase ApaH/serine/threonine PP2A family protein phosphatase
MRYLILSDIHANLEALEACLTDAGARGYDETLVLGDLVGYGADPDAVVDRVLDLGALDIVRGNHDKIACGIDKAEGFNAVAKSAAEWTLSVLTSEHRAWLAALPAGPHAVDGLVEICHGSPFDEDAYVFDETDARQAIDAASRPLCLFGHTHVPIVFHLSGDALNGARPSRESLVKLPLIDGTKYLVNPGSVGQPRDGDPRAAYAIVDVGRREVELIRVDYDFRIAQRKILDAGLPQALARRLSAGR